MNGVGEPWYIGSCLGHNSGNRTSAWSPLMIKTHRQVTKGSWTTRMPMVRTARLDKAWGTPGEYLACFSPTGSFNDVSTNQMAALAWRRWMSWLGAWRYYVRAFKWIHFFLQADCFCLEILWQSPVFHLCWPGNDGAIQDLVGTSTRPTWLFQNFREALEQPNEGIYIANKLVVCFVRPAVVWFQQASVLTLFSRVEWRMKSHWRLTSLLQCWSSTCPWR